MDAPVKNYSKSQLIVLVMLRVLIGWHLMYEGIVKLWNPDWTSAGYLRDSKGLFANFFHNLAKNPDVLKVLDWLNMWGLVFVGAALMLGLFARWAAIGGIVLISLYYLSHPPLIGLSYALPSEGSYLLVNKNLIEIFALAVLLVFPSSKIIGCDLLLKKMFGKDTKKEQK